MEVIDEEREERLERVRRRALEWQTNHFCRGIILEMVETSIVEAEWRQQACMELVMDVMEGAVKESRQRMCKQIIVESVVCSSWQSLEVRRLRKVDWIGWNRWSQSCGWREKRESV